MILPRQIAINSFYKTDDELSVISWNLRGSDLDNGITTKWNVRSKVVTGILDKIQADIIGTQEGQLNQIKFIQNAGYSTDISKTIFYNETKLNFLQGEKIWLSQSGKANEVGWDASSPRSFAWGLFELKSNEKDKFIFINLHLDHVGYESRLESIKIIVRNIEKLKNQFGEFIPIILVGDFNSVKYSKVWDSLIDTSGLLDTSLELYDKDNIEFTYHHFHGLHFHNFYMRIVQYISYYVSCTEFGRKVTGIPSCFAPSLIRSIKENLFGNGKVHHIDWILHNYVLEPKQFFVITDHKEIQNPVSTNNWWHPKEFLHRSVVNSAIYPSDHFPVFASFVFNYEGAIMCKWPSS